MTTNNGGDVLVGVVTRVNDRGLILADSPDEWLNVSRYAKPAPKLPKVGERVQVTLDGQGYVRQVDVLHDEARTRYETGGPPDEGVDVPPPDEPSRQVERTAPAHPDRDVQIRRMNALTTATAILSSGGQVVDPTDVLSLAAKLEAWVTR